MAGKFPAIDLDWVGTQNLIAPELGNHRITEHCKVLIVSAASPEYFDLLTAMFASVRDAQVKCAMECGYFDLELEDEQRIALELMGVMRIGNLHRFTQNTPSHLNAFYNRSCLPEIMPGYDVYIWIDADAWVQRAEALEDLIYYAMKTGFAVVPEYDLSYDLEWIYRAHYKSFLYFSPMHADRLLRMPPLNAGVFSGRATAPIWRLWRSLIEKWIKLESRERKNQSALWFLLDQTALAITCASHSNGCAYLPATYNWMCHLSAPAVSNDGRMLLHPRDPQIALNIIHQTGGTKRTFPRLLSEDGRRVYTSLAYRGRSMIPIGDYVAPDLAIVIPDSCFPNMIKGDVSLNSWRYLRKGHSHSWYTDKRGPAWGFLSRDEAILLYNIALSFEGLPALEIGCFYGWSTCHLALAGVRLDVIDPLLDTAPFAESVRSSLRKAGVESTVSLWSGSSPAKVHNLAKERPGGWSLFFIDGNHERPAPLEDTKACEPYAAAEAMFIYHDLASPDVTEALFYLKERGWNVRVFVTAQIMGAAWRGNVNVIDHKPDPPVLDGIPAHLNPLLSG